ncbi:MAG: SusD/RagB family nutrient-binding outer membrane lipoprotein [Bacteroidales bacterium]|jgi:hypothetical protein
MKLIVKYLIVFSMILTFVSCEKNFLDINTDPNNPLVENGTPELLFPGAVTSSAGRIGAEYAIVGGMWSQYWTQSNAANQYKAYDQFNITQTTVQNTWSETFSGALNDYYNIIKMSKENEDWIYYLMASVMNAYTYQIMVDFYDQVPYDEAFQGDQGNYTPIYNDGEYVYNKLIEQMNDALAQDFTARTNSIVTKTDFVFGGDLTKWKQFANTLMLKMYLRMVYAKPDVAKTGIEALYANGNGFLSSDAAMTQFSDAASKSNPLYEYNFRQLNVATNLRASVTFMSWLQANGDPRIDAYFTPGSGGQKAMNQGTFSLATSELDPATVSVALVHATDPVYFISAAESYFLQAEALERFFAGAGAQEAYEFGIESAFAQVGMATDGIYDAGQPYAYPTGDFESKLEAIITQKWASLPGAHAFEAFFERNRTGYPKTSPVFSDDSNYVPGQIVYPAEGISSGQFPKRLMFPDIESTRNPNTPTPVSFTTKVWWDKK